MIIDACPKCNSIHNRLQGLSGQEGVQCLEKDKGIGLCLRKDIANTLSSKFNLLFLIIIAKNLADSKVKEDERFSINISLPASQSFFNFFPLLCLFKFTNRTLLVPNMFIQFLFLGVNSENEDKLSCFSKEFVALGFEGEL
jgi:hypothetical protein